MAALQPVGAEGTTTNAGANTAATTATTKYKEIHYVTFKNGNPVDIKDPLTGDAAAKAGESHPEITGYKYGSSRPDGDILYHAYSLIANEQPANNNGSAQTNPYHRDNNGTNNNNQNNSGTSNQNSSSTNYVWSIKDGKRYLTLNGKPVTGLQTVDGKKYYFGIDGAAKVGVYTEGDKRFYFDDKGVLQKGWFKIGDKYYYFNEDGTILKGIFTVGDKKYYLEDGVQVVGLKKVENKW